MRVVGPPLVKIEKTIASKRQLAQQSLRISCVRSRLERMDVRHLAIRRVVDRLFVWLEQAQAKQSIVIRRLFGRRDSKP